MRKENLIDEYDVVETNKGKMFIGFDDWSELERVAKDVGGEIHHLRKHNGEVRYISLGRDFEPHDRKRDFDDNSEVFEYSDEIEDAIYEKCFRHRFEVAVNDGDIEAIEDLILDYKSALRMVEYMDGKTDILVIGEYLQSDVIERYPTIWSDDVWEYRMALKVPTED